ncbi:sigma 54-interacting transcriptional regulator [Pelosinus sp. IPA-1]|uniref:sigma 54-interacting transcriptional regulator n=1 Tax=Pelosinus sp. IPA-1 TaxID=3029569 RepID=UPI0024361BEC|nr:sigma 54-interacting transcriptional regulator [Pelosinus sp. IPA-1]GMA98711.1 sigma-54-dependent Fis family transcriptional regulator [Pelosinus sp. IPA-1]
MSLIAFIAPDMSLFESARQLFKAHHNDIHIVKGLLHEGVAIATALCSKGTEIIISRGGTATAIRNSGLEVTVVEIPITGFDIIRTVEKAKLHGHTIGAVTFSSLLQETDCLSPILGVDIRLYPIDAEEEAETQVSQAFQDGVNVVIGGFITKQIAQKQGYPFELIGSGAEGILQAAQEAKRIAHARNLEKEKTSLFRAVLNYAYEGIISVDSQYRITFFNPIAEQITGISSSKATGKNIAKVWPELNLKQVMHMGKDDLAHILKINEVDVLCNKIAIVVNNTTVGAVVTFQDVAQIQQMEARVRRRIYDFGHIANYSFKNIESTSTELISTIEMAKDFALTHSSILIIGETGTGKEVFAQSIHNYSERHQGPFVAINCAALPSQILESELFGYVGGAFTGANPKGKPGLFEVAHGGTIFLDEIAEMEYVTQSKLLRIVQEKKVMRLGSDRVIPIDVRVIAATNKNLKNLVNENKFRADLYYRLNVLQLRIPPLRNRKEDIKLLAQFFLKEHQGIIKHHLKLAPSAIKALTEYTWPGNIRELQNIIERVIAVHKIETIDATIINRLLGDQQDNKDDHADILPNELEEIKKALALTKGKYAAAAKILGISRSTLWRKLKHFGISKTL